MLVFFCNADAFTLHTRQLGLVTLGLQKSQVPDFFSALVCKTRVVEQVLQMSSSLGESVVGLPNEKALGLGPGIVDCPETRLENKLPGRECGV